MSIFSETYDYLADGENWKGAEGIPTRFVEHVELTTMSVGIAAAIAIPIGLWLGHIGRGGNFAINLSNVGRAIPTYALLVLLFVAMGASRRDMEAVIALTAFALPPMLTNTYVGVREVDPEAKEAARGMGMSGGQLLRRVEVPLAMPLILDGLRIAVVQVVATVSVAALIGVGGLGRLIKDGFDSGIQGQYGAGAVIIGVFALVLEGLFVLLQRRVDPVRRASRGGLRLSRG